MFEHKILTFEHFAAIRGQALVFGVWFELLTHGLTQCIGGVVQLLEMLLKWLRQQTEIEFRCEKFKDL
jgi:hypothetical protein